MDAVRSRRGPVSPNLLFGTLSTVFPVRGLGCTNLKSVTNATEEA